MAEGRKQTSTEAFANLGRNHDIVTLRATGLSLWELATKFGISKSQVARIVQAEIAQWRKENQKKIEDWITKDLMMLDRMQFRAARILFDTEGKTTDKSRMAAMRNIIAGMDRRAKLMGLDKRGSTEDEADRTITIIGGLPPIDSDDADDAEFKDVGPMPNVPAVVQPENT